MRYYFFPLLFMIVCANPTYAGDFIFVDSGQSLGGFDWAKSLAMADLDKDGDVDAFIAQDANCSNPDDQRCGNWVWLNDGTGIFQNSGQNLGNSNSYDIAVADVDHDGDVDAVVANPGENIRIWNNDGAANFVESDDNITRYQRAFAIELGDLDNDGDVDIITAETGNPSKVFLNSGDGVFQDSGQLLGVDYVNSVALGDIDLDGDLDAVFAIDYDSNILHNYIWINDGNAGFSASTETIIGSYYKDVDLGDLDKDGDLDIILVSSFDNDDIVLFNDGAGSFAISEQKLPGRYSSSVSLGDVDLDGDLDIFVTASTFSSNNTLWINDGTGQFSDSGMTFNNSCIDAKLQDLDNDGDLDIFTISPSQPSKIWINSRNLRGDINNDGKIDLIDTILTLQFSAGL